MKLENMNFITDLSGPDGNAFVVMGAVVNILKQVAFQKDIDDYRIKARSKDYRHLLEVSRDTLKDLGITFVDESNSYPDILGYAVTEIKVCFDGSMV